MELALLTLTKIPVQPVQVKRTILNILILLIACDSTCLECTSSDPNACSSCDSGGTSPLFYNTACYAIGSCPSHSYQDSGTTCASCHATCLDCIDSTSSGCTSCDSGGSLPLLYSNVCYGSCPSGTYQDSSSTCIGKKKFTVENFGNKN